jgi:maltooligosyltrehalose trehalohydrolase
LMSRSRLKIGAALVFTSPFVPMLFQGEEWGASTPFQYFTSHSDPALGEAVSRGRREEFRAFGWMPEDVPDPQHGDTFHNSKLQWDEPSRAPHSEILDWHRQLVAVRKRILECVDTPFDEVKAEANEADGWLVFRRGVLAVACNISAQPRSVPLLGAGPFELMLASHRHIRPDASAVTLPPESVAILVERPATSA